MQTIEIEINESDRFTETTASIHILVLLSDSYIRKKIQSEVRTNICARGRNIIVLILNNIKIKLLKKFLKSMM